MKWAKLRKELGMIIEIVTTVLIILLAWSITYWINPYLFKWLGWNITGYWAYLLNSIAALIILGIVLAVLVPLARNKQLAFLSKISDALKRISKGDYDVEIIEDDKFSLDYGIIVRDIHAMADQMGQMEKMRQEFISNVSHEIQSPLTSIRGFARALQEDVLDEEQRKHYLQIIEMETVRLSKLSDNLLKLTSLESDQHNMNQSTYSLDHQLRAIVLANEPQWQAKNLELELDMDKTTITADEDLLSQVWVNLLHNAIKFTPEEGTIRIQLQQIQGDVYVSIEDSGIGIDEEHLPHIFERFYKADVARNRSLGGNGLGLSIVQKIVNLHHGSVQVNSQSGVGTKFIVKLPLAPPGTLD